MKKVLIAGLLAVTSGNVLADDWGVFLGGDLTRSTTDGSINHDAANFESKTRGSSYAALEHSIILLPQVRVAYNNLDTGGNRDGKGVSTDLNSYDGTLYYQLLDNDLIELDLGLNIKFLDGNVTDGAYARSIDSTIPQVYGSAKFHIPGTNFSLIGDLATGGVTDDNAIDALAGVTYTFNPDSMAKFKVRAGYKYQEIKLKDKVNLDQDFKGFFIGGEVHF